MFYYKAQALAELQEVHQAVMAAEKAIELSPTTHDYHLLLANLLFARHDFEGALREAETALQLKQDSFPAAMLYGRSLYTLKLYDRALQYFTKVNNVVPENFEVLQ